MQEKIKDDLISRQDAYDTLTEYYHHTTQTQHDALRDALSRVPSAQPEQQWIPCSKRLPDGQGFYLVSVGAPYKTVRVYEYKPCEWYENENLWKKEDGAYCFNWFVKAWMPLPEPYKGDEQNG